MRHAVSDLFFSIRKSPFLFLFTFVQILITSLILYSVLADFFWIESENNRAQISWGNYEYMMIMPKSSALQSQEYRYKTIQLTVASGISVKNNDSENYNEMVEYYQQLESFYTKAQNIEGLKIIPNQPSWQLYLDQPKEWKEEDKYGQFSIVNSDTQNRFNKLNTCYIGKEYLKHFNVRISEGEAFKEEDYLYSGDFIPVLMGAAYRKYYSLGEEFTANVIARTNVKFKVTGFIAENQYYTTVNSSDVRSYDNIILIPYLERGLEEYLNDFSSYRYLYTARIVFSYYMADADKYEAVNVQLKNLLEENGLDKFLDVQHKHIEKELASNYKDQLVISIAVCIAALLFSLFSFIFTMLYKIDDNIKNYAIRMVVGETYTGIALRYLFESFIVFLFGQMTGFFAFKIYAVNSYIYQGYEFLEAPALRTGILLNVAFYILTAVILYICVNVKLKTYSLATLIRGNEVKKERRMPFYRVVIFLMLAIVGVFGMFIASYQVALDRIDIYYNSYYTKNVKMAYVNPFAVEGAPDVKAKCDEICENVNDAIINKYISTGYKGDDFIEERGLYFNGYIDPVNMLEGRFFTHEEVSGKDKIAVVGKDIYEKYVTVNDKGEKVYHSEDLDADLLVIGVMGKEDQATSIDLTVFTPLRVGTEKFGSAGSYTLDGKDKGTVEKLAEAFEKYVSETGMVSLRDYHPRITVEAPTDTLLMLLILVIINAIVFCFYYVSKQGHIHAVKKIVGYSKTMIISDTFADFLVLTLGAFVAGNALVILLKETLFRNVQLFSIYMLDPQVIVMTLIAVVLLTVFLSVIAVTKTFAAGNGNEYRV